MNHPLIQFENVTKRFNDKVVLNGVNLRINKGEITTIIGKSGGGKSVLLKHIIGLIEKDSGEIFFNGNPISKMTNAERKAIKSKFSYMFQGTALFDSMTVFENIALPLKEKTKLSAKDIRQRVMDKMALLDLHDIEEKYPSQLSGGMKKRVALARALITNPEIVLFDEPTTGLDPIRKNAVHSMISNYQKRFGFTAVIVSHEIPDIFYISQRIAMLDEGRIIFEGTPEEIQNVQNRTVQSFIQGIESPQDDLTGLSHQSILRKRFTEELFRMQSHDHPFSVILLKIESLDELDGMTRYAADQTALKTFATQIQKHLRVTDICSRYGLNKIMLLLPNTSKEEAQKICTNLAQEVIKDESSGIKPYPGFCFAVSAGICEASRDSSLEKILEEAELNQNRFYEFKIC